MRVASKPCPYCGRVKTLTVSAVKWRAWRAGNLLAQQVGLSADDTERMMTGLCPDCWDLHIVDAAERAEEESVAEHERSLMGPLADHLFEGKGE